MNTEIIKLSQNNFYKICRICYQQEELIDIFQSTYQDITFAVILETILPQKISKKDGLPTHCCLKCLKSVLTLNAFLEQYRASTEALRSVYNLLYASENPNDCKNGKKCIIQIRYANIPNTETLLAKCSLITQIKDDSTKTKIEGTELSTYPSQIIHFIKVPKPVEFQESPYPDIEPPQKKIFVRIGPPAKDIEAVISTKTPSSAICSETVSSPKLSIDLKLPCLHSGSTFKNHLVFEHRKKNHSTTLKLKPGKVTCAICNKLFITKSRLRLHISNCHIIVECPECNVKLKKGSIIRHKRRYHGVQQISCFDCNKIFHTKIGLREHTNKSHTIIECHAKVKKGSLRQHIQGHNFPHSGSEKICANCNKPFPTKIRLRKHIYRCRKIVECPEYSVKLPNGSPGHHQRNHSEHSPHFITENTTIICCADCNKPFGSKKRLREHINRYHTSVECPECNVRVKRGSLGMHRKGHELETVTKLCPICGKFVVAHRLQKHVIACHEAPKSFQCTLCPFKTEIKTSMTRHQSKHKGNLLCNACGKEFTYKSTFTSHMKLHDPFPQPKPCAICSETTETLFDYRKHIMKNHSAHPTIIFKTQDNHLTNQMTEKTTTEGMWKRKKICKECGAICANYVAYVDHMRIKHGVDSRVCVICKTRVYGQMSIHLQNHSRDPIFIKQTRQTNKRIRKCKINGCYFVCCNYTAYTDHMKYAHQIETCLETRKCVPCNKVFRYPNHLKRHNIMVHENKRDHKCPYCGRGFNLDSGLQDHVRLHTGEMIQCGYCQESFRHYHKMYKHIWEVHNIKGQRIPNKKTKDTIEKVIKSDKTVIKEEGLLQI